MKLFLCPAAELMVLVPGAILCLLPVWQNLKIPKWTAAILLPLVLIVYALAGGFICAKFWISAKWLLYPTLPFLVFFYCKITNMSHWKPVSVFMGVWGVFSCLSGVAKVMDAWFGGSIDQPWPVLEAGIGYLLLCCILVLLVSYPAARSARRLLQNETLLPTRYVFWVLPAIFIVINLFITPKSYEVLRIGRMMEVYASMSLVHLCLLLSFYLLFFMIAKGLSRNASLSQQNQLLQMQTVRYEALRSSIAETRQARHDLRHHFTTLGAMADREDWSAVRSYLEKAHGSIPDLELTYCENRAVDGVVGHYGAHCIQAAIPFAAKLDLPEQLPVEEMELCLILSNLLENAVEASLLCPPEERAISLHGDVQGSGFVVLSIENRCGPHTVSRNGILRSTKRDEAGVGLQSVIHMAERGGGTCRIQQLPGLFRVDVVLRRS